MATIGKCLGQSAPAATTPTNLYTVPAATQADALWLDVCNRGGTSTTFRVSIAVGGGATADKDYKFYDLPIAANDTYGQGVKWTLAATDVVRVYAGNASLSFSLHGLETT